MAFPVWASDGPSYEKTVEFLQGKLNTVTRYDNSKSNQWFIELERCIFAVVTQSTPPKDFSAKLFEAAQFDPSKVEVRTSQSSPGVKVGTREARKLDTAYLGVYTTKLKTDVPCDQAGWHKQRLKTYPKLGNHLTIPKSKQFCSSKAPQEWDDIYFGSILGPSDDNAPRVAKALQHLIALCGGKEELF